MQRIDSPRTDDSAVEQEIRAKGLTAPRITPADIEANIDREHYFTAAQGVLQYEQDLIYNNPDKYPEGEIHLAGYPLQPLDLLTFCVLVLKNGFTVTGESACASPENFDAEIGRKIARQNAINKVWPLMGYELKQRLSEGEE